MKNQLLLAGLMSVTAFSIQAASHQEIKDGLGSLFYQAAVVAKDGAKTVGTEIADTLGDLKNGALDFLYYGVVGSIYHSVLQIGKHTPVYKLGYFNGYYHGVENARAEVLTLGKIALTGIAAYYGAKYIAREILYINALGKKVKSSAGQDRE